MGLPVVFQYQRALDEFRRRPDSPAPLLKRMSELISLLDLTTTLGSDLSGEEILDAALLIVMGELGASRGALFVRDEAGAYRLRASRGLPPGVPNEAPLGVVAGDAVMHRREGRHPELFEAFDLSLVCPILKAGRAIAALGLGPRADGSSYGDEEAAFVRSVAAAAATPIENGLIYHELKRVNQRLSLKVFQLHSLFDISRELTRSFDEETIQSLVATTLMGHLMVSRCALYRLTGDGLVLAHARGLRGSEEGPPVEIGQARRALEALRVAVAVDELPEGEVRERLRRTRMALAVPLPASDQPLGLLAVGERPSGVPFSEEDREFAQTLARQAAAALESVRLHRVQVQKQRQDRELQIAREIQQSLFPASCPVIQGFEVAAASHSCYEVGGDYYDFIPIAGGRLALVVADVSGKGTPASILMASVHASLKALAGTAAPALLMERLNTFLFESTQANKFVTLFYAELDPARSSLSYVTAGHVPPYHIRADGSVSRLMAGGPALGLLEGMAFEAGEVRLESGDVLAAVTDGATEALSPDELEFGDERVCAALLAARETSAAAMVDSLVGAASCWSGSAGRSDDLTALILKAL